MPQPHNRPGAHGRGEGTPASEARAEDWPAGAVEDFHTLAIECIATPGAALLPAVPGLPDAAFQHEASSPSARSGPRPSRPWAPVPGQLLWDVGAGCGSVAIEWMRSVSRGRAIAVERAPERAALIAANAAALGTPLLEVVEGEAPAALAGLAEHRRGFSSAAVSLRPGC